MYSKYSEHTLNVLVLHVHCKLTCNFHITKYHFDCLCSMLLSGASMNSILQCALTIQSSQSKHTQRKGNIHVQYVHVLYILHVYVHVCKDPHD